MTKEELKPGIHVKVINIGEVEIIDFLSHTFSSLKEPKKKVRLNEANRIKYRFYAKIIKLNFWFYHKKPERQ